MFALRHIRLGHGIKSVSEQGVAGVVSSERKADSIAAEQQFTFNAKLYDSHEELEQGFRAALSLSGSAVGADLALGASTNTQVQSSSYDSYYMMHLEYRHYRRELKLYQEGGTLLKPGIQTEIEGLKNLSEWQAFYRKNGDLVINSVTYGERVIIIVSLNRKVRNEQVRQALETNVHLPSQAAFKAELEKQLKQLTEDTVASVQIHSLGNARPNFLEEIDNLARLRERITGFVNSTTPMQTSPAPSPAPEKRTLPLELETDTINSESGEMSHQSNSFDTGTIIHYTTCSYLDLIPNPSDAFRHAYHQMLKCTSLARQYMQALSRCSQRVKALMRDINLYLQGEFIISHAFEAQAHELLSYFSHKNTVLSGWAEELLSHVSGLGDTASKRRKALAKAKNMYELTTHFPDLLIKKPLTEQSAFITEYIEDFKLLKANAALEENKQSLFSIAHVFPLPYLATLASINQQTQKLEEITNHHIENLIHHAADLKNEVETIFEHNQSIVPLTRQLADLLEGILNAIEIRQPEGRPPFIDINAAWKEAREIITQLSELDMSLCPEPWQLQINALSSLVSGVKTPKRSDSPDSLIIQSLAQALSVFLNNIERISAHPYILEPQFDRETLKSPEELHLFNSGLMQFAHLLGENFRTTELLSTLAELTSLTAAYHEKHNEITREKEKLIAQIRLSPEATQLLEQNYKAHLSRIDERFSDSTWWESRWKQIYTFSKELDRFLETSPIDTPMHTMLIKEKLETYYAHKKHCDQRLRQLETLCSMHLPWTNYSKIVEETSASLGVLLDHIPGDWLTKSSHKNRLLEKYHQIKERCDELLQKMRAPENHEPVSPDSREQEIEAIQIFLNKITALRESIDDTRPSTCSGIDFKYSAYLAAEFPLKQGFLQVYSDPVSPYVPSQTRFLRFKCCTEAFIPNEPTFTLRRSSKIRMEGHEGKHSGLHKQIRPLERIKPRLIKGEKVRQYIQGQSEKASLIETDRNPAYKRIYLEHVKGLPKGQKAIMMLYTQLGVTKSPLGFSNETPHPQPDYGSRVSLSGQAGRSEAFADHPAHLRMARRRNSSPFSRTQAQSPQTLAAVPVVSSYRMPNSNPGMGDIQRSNTEDIFGNTYRVVQSRRTNQQGSSNSISALMNSNSFLGAAVRAQQASSSEPSSREEIDEVPQDLQRTHSDERRETIAPRTQ